jgi:hypothetical protein
VFVRPQNDVLMESAKRDRAGPKND